MVILSSLLPSLSSFLLFFLHCHRSAIAVFLPFWSSCTCPRTRGWQDTCCWGRQEQSCSSSPELWSICQREKVFLFLLMLMSVLFSYLFLSTFLLCFLYLPYCHLCLESWSHGPWLAAEGGSPPPSWHISFLDWSGHFYQHLELFCSVYLTKTYNTFNLLVGDFMILLLSVLVLTGDCFKLYLGIS